MSAVHARGTGMNVMDVFFILLLIGIMAAGFFQGLIRLSVLVLAFYLSMVLASLYFVPFGEFLTTHIQGDRAASEYIAFLVIMLFAFFILGAAGLYTFRYAEMPGKLQYVDSVGGFFLGIVLAALVEGVLAAMLWNMFIVHGGRDLEIPFFGAIGSSVYNSFLLQYFSEFILPETYNLVRPILPSAASIIFETR